jgi:hypothetical protein
VAIGVLLALALASQGLSLMTLLPMMFWFGSLGGILYGSLPALISIVVCVVLRRGRAVTFRLLWITGCIVSVPTTILGMLFRGEPLTNAPGMVVGVLLGGTLASGIAWQLAKRTRVVLPVPAI